MFGLYIHFPFCKSRCSYCDFYSQTDETLKARYLSAMLREMTLRKSEHTLPMRTIYLGGGTPSLFSVKELNLLFEKIDQLWGLGACKEITMEANPDDLSVDYIRELKSTPINRLSIGIQSFMEEDLKYIHRRHTSLQALRAVENASLIGFENISIDLIYGLPFQTLLQWEKNLNQAFLLPITHLSAYQLTIEEGTPLSLQLQKGLWQEVEEDVLIEMFKLLQKKTAEKGMLHYEISNFSLPGFTSLHNSSYWEGIPYLGIGAAAHSFSKGVRRENEPSILRYLTALERGEPPPYTEEKLTPEEEYNDYILTHLRTAKGIDLKEFELFFGKGKREKLLKGVRDFTSQGIVNVENDRISLFPNGVLLSDEVIRELIIVK